MNNLVSLNILNPEYVASYDPLELDQGIQDYLKIANNAVLNVSLTLVRIQAEKVYLLYGCRSMNNYIEGLTVRMQVSRSNVYNWLLMGKMYLKHQAELDARGFRQEEGATKLTYLERALKKHPKDEVFDKLMTLSRREFIAYARGTDKDQEGRADLESISAMLADTFANNEINESEEITLENINPHKKQKISNENKDTPWKYYGKTLYYRGRWVLALNLKLPWNILNMVSKAIKVACNALDRKGAVLAVHLNDIEEMQRIKKPIIRLRDEMRSGTFKAEDNVLRFLR
ncbi:MAG: hypothetical protein FWH12_07955 [Treponema sp.]|nr:hypothetical protein [Treponema sp.]